jgi:choline dehydrogenase
MGADDDPLAVLDEQCRVRGIDALRVVDSSIFPTIPNGNLNAPTIMVAERAADMILGKPLQSSQDTPVWIAPNWQEMQRMHPPKRELDSLA